MQWSKPQCPYHSRAWSTPVFAVHSRSVPVGAVPSASGCCQRSGWPGTAAGTSRPSGWTTWLRSGGMAEVASGYHPGLVAEITYSIAFAYSWKKCFHLVTEWKAEQCLPNFWVCNCSSTQIWKILFGFATVLLNCISCIKWYSGDASLILKAKLLDNVLIQLYWMYFKLTV